MMDRNDIDLEIFPRDKNRKDRAKSTLLPLRLIMPVGLSNGKKVVSE
jgi:hypothetical protein